jgi:uncharacterized protein RhaS with RHS repeats
VNPGALGLEPYHYYDPQAGRWTQQDPLGTTGHLSESNRYVYVGDNPVSQTDLSGTHICGPFADECDAVGNAASDVYKGVRDVARSGRRARGRSPRP